MRSNKALLAIVLAATVAAFAGCRVGIKDVKGADIKYTAEYGYGDLQVLSDEMARRILASPPASEPTPPVMLVFGIDNRTTEHIDTKALTDAIRNKLFKSGKFQFINESTRVKLDQEMTYQDQGFISEETKIKFGKQVGAKYLLSGSLVSITQDQLRQVRIKRHTLRYYRLTLEITDVNTNLIVWTDEQEIVREESKPFVGW